MSDNDSVVPLPIDYGYGSPSHGSPQAQNEIIGGDPNNPRPVITDPGDPPAGDPFPPNLDPGGWLDRDLFVESMVVLATLTRSPELTPSESQTLLNMMRVDQWKNWQFFDACKYVARRCRRSPSYADFYAWRREEFGDT